MSNFGFERHVNRCSEPCASFSFVPQVVTTIAPGGQLVWNAVVENLSRQCCSRDIDLNTNTGDIFIKREGKYQIGVSMDAPGAADTWVQVTTGNGATARPTVYNLTGQITWNLYVKRDSVIKVVVGGTGAGLVFTPGADVTLPMAVIEIVKLEA